MNRQNFIKILAAPAIVASTGVYRPGWCGAFRGHPPFESGQILLSSIGERMTLSDLHYVTPPTEEEFAKMVESAKAQIEADVLQQTIRYARGFPMSLYEILAARSGRKTFPIDSATSK